MQEVFKVVVLGACFRVVSAALSAADADYFEVMLRLAGRWKLSDRKTRQLLAVPERTLYHWKAGRPHLSADERDRVSHLANIEIMLNAIFNDEPVARDWLRRPNGSFEERTPLQVMMQEGFAGVLRVRTYLQTLR